jgi:hypothetical protein
LAVPTIENLESLWLIWCPGLWWYPIPS